MQLPRILRGFGPTLHAHPWAVGFTILSLFFGGLSVLLLGGELWLSHLREQNIAAQVRDTLTSVQTLLVRCDEKLSEIDHEGDDRDDVLKDVREELRSVRVLAMELMKREGIVPPAEEN